MEAPLLSSISRLADDNGILLQFQQQQPHRVSFGAWFEVDDGADTSVDGHLASCGGPISFCELLRGKDAASWAAAASCDLKLLQDEGAVTSVIDDSRSHLPIRRARHMATAAGLGSVPVAYTFDLAATSSDGPTAAVQPRHWALEAHTGNGCWRVVDERKLSAAHRWISAPHDSTTFTAPAAPGAINAGDEDRAWVACISPSAIGYHSAYRLVVHDVFGSDGGHSKSVNGALHITRFDIWCNGDGTSSAAAQMEPSPWSSYSPGKSALRGSTTSYNGASSSLSPSKPQSAASSASSPSGSAWSWRLFLSGPAGQRRLRLQSSDGLLDAVSAIALAPTWTHHVNVEIFPVLVSPPVSASPSNDASSSIAVRACVHLDGLVLPLLRMQDVLSQGPDAHIAHPFVDVRIPTPSSLPVNVSGGGTVLHIGGAAHGRVAGPVTDAPTTLPLDAPAWMRLRHSVLRQASARPPSCIDVPLDSSVRGGGTRGFNGRVALVTTRDPPFANTKQRLSLHRPSMAVDPCPFRPYSTSLHGGAALRTLAAPIHSIEHALLWQPNPAVDRDAICTVPLASRYPEFAASSSSSAAATSASEEAAAGAASGTLSSYLGCTHGIGHTKPLSLVCHDCGTSVYKEDAHLVDVAGALADVTGAGASSNSDEMLWSQDDTTIPMLIGSKRRADTRAPAASGFEFVGPVGGALAPSSGSAASQLTTISAEPRHVYRFEHWQACDIFVYFSHHRVTIPPPSWIQAAHSNGCRILGTIITEWADGQAANEIMMLPYLGGAASAATSTLIPPAASGHSDINTLAFRLASIASYYGFDGWLVNIESPLPDVPSGAIHTAMDHMSAGKGVDTDTTPAADQLNAASAPAALYPSSVAMRNFLGDLTAAVHSVAPDGNGLVVWYDSIDARTGRVAWQSELNDANTPFLDVCDGIFLDYHWNLEMLGRTVARARICGAAKPPSVTPPAVIECLLAKSLTDEPAVAIPTTTPATSADRSRDVFVGIDMWGRGSYGGGGWNTWKAVQAIVDASAKGDGACDGTVDTDNGDASAPATNDQEVALGGVRAASVPCPVSAANASETPAEQVPTSDLVEAPSVSAAATAAAAAEAAAMSATAAAPEASASDAATVFATAAEPEASAAAEPEASAAEPATVSGAAAEPESATDAATVPAAAAAPGARAAEAATKSAAAAEPDASAEVSSSTTADDVTARKSVSDQKDGTVLTDSPVQDAISDALPALPADSTINVPPPVPAQQLHHLPLSIALFGPAWTYEAQGGQRKGPRYFRRLEERMWGGSSRPDAASSAQGGRDHAVVGGGDDDAGYAVVVPQSVTNPNGIHLGEDSRRSILRSLGNDSGRLQSIMLHGWSIDAAPGQGWDVAMDDVPQSDSDNCDHDDDDGDDDISGVKRAACFVTSHAWCWSSQVVPLQVQLPAGMSPRPSSLMSVAAAPAAATTSDGHENGGAVAATTTDTLTITVPGSSDDHASDVETTTATPLVASEADPSTTTNAILADVEVSEWYRGTGPNHEDSYRLKASLCSSEGQARGRRGNSEGNDGAVVTDHGAASTEGSWSFDSGVLTCSNEWRAVKHVFRDVAVALAPAASASASVSAGTVNAQPPSASPSAAATIAVAHSIKIEHGGKDAEHWAGHFGARMRGLKVVVKVRSGSVDVKNTPAAAGGDTSGAVDVNADRQRWISPVAIGLTDALGGPRPIPSASLRATDRPRHAASVVTQA